MENRSLYFEIFYLILPFQSMQPQRKFVEQKDESASPSTAHEFHKYKFFLFFLFKANRKKNVYYLVNRKNSKILEKRKVDKPRNQSTNNHRR